MGRIMPNLSLHDALQRASERFRAGQLAPCEQICRDVLSQQPTVAPAWHLLGLIALQTGKSLVAIDLIRRAIAIDPAVAEFHNSLGNALADRGSFQDAAQAFSQAIRLRPDLAETRCNLGRLLVQTEQLEQAIAEFQTAVQFKPELFRAHLSLADALRDSGQFERAAGAYRSALALRPDDAAAWNNLGNVLLACATVDEAIQAYRKAISVDPGIATAHLNLGSALKEAGELHAAFASWREAIQLDSRDHRAGDNLIYYMHFHPDCVSKSIRDEQQRWVAQHAAIWPESIPPHRNDRNPNRPLRVGYVGAGFCDHCQSFFTLPFFSNHDPSQFEVFVYANVRRPDAITQRLKRHASHWRDIVNLPDDQAAGLIRQDCIDILVDLTLHMADSRLPIFARKPAPVQVTWLGYPGSTGLPAMDYRLTDPYLDPPEIENDAYSEASIRLPDSFWCYDPLTVEPVVNGLPAASSGRVTFGCMNMFCKINDGVIDIWSEVLRAAPASSRLFILAPRGSHRQRVTESFRDRGVDSSRVDFLDRCPRAKYLKLFHQLDLLLDTFPYNGHTTSLDSFWMGVPVVSLAGKTAVSRAGLSLATNLGLTELVATDAQQFVNIAIGLADDLPRLAQLRATLRQRMQDSPLMDAPRFTRNLEAAFRQMWQRWCATGTL
jgi:predicted O-linked N-acetylglucosamine transferase (SPINDLY family)